MRSAPLWISPFKNVPVVSTTAWARIDVTARSDYPGGVSVLGNQVFHRVRAYRKPGLACERRANALGGRVGDPSGRAGHAPRGPGFGSTSRNWMPAPNRRRGRSDRLAHRPRGPDDPCPNRRSRDCTTSRRSVSSLCVSNRVLAPKRADAAAASQPAWPPPITMTSQVFDQRHARTPLPDFRGTRGPEMQPF